MLQKLHFDLLLASVWRFNGGNAKKQFAGFSLTYSKFIILPKFLSANAKLKFMLKNSGFYFWSTEKNIP